MCTTLVQKTIYDLLGENFFIPYYQRGYRWTQQQVNDLLNDIWSFAKKPTHKEHEFYCLQPIVVKARSWEVGGTKINDWEVVDGQQRLTTIYIILHYLIREFLRVDDLRQEYGKSLFSIRYETRQDSEAFLKNIREDTSNIDYYHMYMAYVTAKSWFESQENTRDRNDRNMFLQALLGREDRSCSVQVIWYQVDSLANSLDLFTRLNIGKIPLTNAELIKALFLSSSSFDEPVAPGMVNVKALKKKTEVALVWDEMEQALCDEDLWAFITNEPQSTYTNRIEMLFDMIADKKSGELDPYFTFIHFVKRTKEGSEALWKTWLVIEQYFLTLKEWYGNKNLYHKIGYIITIGEDLNALIKASLTTLKGEFEAELDKLIRNSVDFDIEELEYDKNPKQIERVLLLFNVETIRSNDAIRENYPFKSHKSISWSLEHIHAQNSDGLDRTKKEPWLLWLLDHRRLMADLTQEITDQKKKDEFTLLIGEVDRLNQDRITWEGFNNLAARIIALFTDGSEAEDVHSISNMALLSQADNTTLSNSVFELKRRKIIQMDKKGQYIPICTRRIFLKYYNPMPSSEQSYFWSMKDRQNYVQEMKDGLRKYLPLLDIAEGSAI